MTERLNELRRQRDLVRQHLDWLDAEIARETTAAPSNPGLTDRPSSLTRLIPTAAIAPLAEQAAETILHDYAAESRNSPARAKLGCWFAFAGAFVALGLAFAAWFILRR